jgi:hypothetical protein
MLANKRGRRRSSLRHPSRPRSPNQHQHIIALMLNLPVLLCSRKRRARIIPHIQ